MGGELSIITVTKATSSLWARIIKFGKSVLGATLNGINRKHHNELFQWVRMPQSMQLHPLWHSPNGPMVNILAIIVFLAVLESCSNGQDASNGHIASSWKSVNLCCSDIPSKFHFCKPSFCKVFFGTSCNFSNFAFFFLSFLAFFPVI
jgi:hypothetical protein